MNMMSEPAAARDEVEFKLNGRTVTAFADETLIEAADRLGVEVPRLVHKPGMRPDGHFRAGGAEAKGGGGRSGGAGGARQGPAACGAGAHELIPGTARLKGVAAWCPTISRARKGP